MNDALKKWVFTTCGLCILIMIANFAWKPLPILSYMVVAGMAIFTYLLFAFTFKSNAKGPNPFVRAFMISTFLKIFVVGGFLGLYFYLGGAFRKEITIVTLISYLAFLLLFTRSLQSLRKAN